MLEQPMCPKQEKSRSEHSAPDWLEVAAVSQSASVDRLEPVDVTSSEYLLLRCLVITGDKDLHRSGP